MRKFYLIEGEWSLTEGFQCQALYWVWSVRQSLTSQAPLSPPQRSHSHPTQLPHQTLLEYVLCFATKYNSNTIYDHGEILWENVAPYWPVMDPAWSSPVKITIAYKDMLPCNLTGTSCLVHSLKENAASICGVLLRRTFGDTEVRLVDQLFLYQAFSVLSACEISSN